MFLRNIPGRTGSITDHIGRPVFATNDLGVKVREASCLPFGGVHVAAGGIDLRFPGQWFQAESGLHQNRMRDYDPTTGRYLEADPLGLVDGAVVAAVGDHILGPGWRARSSSTAALSAASCRAGRVMATGRPRSSTIALILVRVRHENGRGRDPRRLFAGGRQTVGRRPAPGPGG